MTNAGGENTLQVGTPVGGLVVGLGVVVQNRLGRIVVVAEDTGPLLAGLVEVLRVEGGVGGTVVDLHARARASVAGVHGLGDSAPVLRGADHFTLGAAAVPSIGLVGGGVEASGGNSGVNNGGLEQLGVGCGHDVLSINHLLLANTPETVQFLGVIHGHHGTRARSGDEDLAGVHLVLLGSPVDHVGDRVAVTTTVVGQSSLGADIPASSAVGAFGVDDNEAILLSQLSVRGASVVSLGGTSA